MKETLQIKANQEANFVPLDLFAGKDMLHPTQLFSATVIIKKGDGQNKVNSVMDLINLNEPPLFEYYTTHGVQREVTIVHAELSGSQDSPYPHDEITVIFPLDEEQIRELQIPQETGTFGY